MPNATSIRATPTMNSVRLPVLPVRMNTLPAETSGQIMGGHLRMPSPLGHTPGKPSVRGALCTRNGGLCLPQIGHRPGGEFMSLKAAITVLRPPDELRRLWQASSYRPEYVESAGAEVRFVEAPGDRGTEIHVTLDEGAPDGKLGHALEKLLGAAPLATVRTICAASSNRSRPASSLAPM